MLAEIVDEDGNRIGGGKETIPVSLDGISNIEISSDAPAPGDDGSEGKSYTSVTVENEETGALAG